MIRYKLRTLLIVLALGPIFLSVGYRVWQTYDATRWREQDVESLYGTGFGTTISHKSRIYLPPAKPGYRFRQARDGIISEIPADAN